jgi:hypothetical protein
VVIIAVLTAATGQIEVALVLTAYPSLCHQVIVAET